MQCASAAGFCGMKFDQHVENDGMTKTVMQLSFNLAAVLLMISCNGDSACHSIDRYALVNRHLPKCDAADPFSPFTIGNGEFAFSVDMTGLQTLNDFYEQGIPLVTQSSWGWHSTPNIQNYHSEQTYKYFDTYDRKAPYASIMDSEPAKYLRANPHRLNLGRIGFKKLNPDYADVQVSDVSQIDQVMDVWEGIIRSSFVLDGCRVNVETCVHPEIDQVAVRIQSQDLSPGVLGIGLDFAYGSSEWGKTASDWSSPERHASQILEHGENFVTIERQLDSTVYYVKVCWKGTAQFKKNKNHSYVLVINSKKKFEFICHFFPQKKITRDTIAATFKKAKQHWRRFWSTGAAVDLSKSPHPDAFELERRIVLSQYLTAIQCSGSTPPQETGLTANSWYGKFHLEMHWWHAAHFALWGHPELLEKSMSWYESILPAARQKAALQGYDGVRWPKMTSPDGLDSPSSVGVFLIWQQPHPIYFAELLYRCNNDAATLNRYKEIVFQTAEFTASYAHWDDKNNRYVLGPPLIPAQEIYEPNRTMNPSFELSYWTFGLKTAQRWRERLGLDRDEKWDHIINHLAPLPVNNGLYQNIETTLNTFQDESQRRDHPMVLGAFGMIPNDQIDIDIMRRTLEEVMTSWNWQSAWGWDFPMAAMTAARVGRPDLAVKALLMDTVKNTYLNNGHNYQSSQLPLYLPGNGGLLTAVAMMAAGWNGAPEVHAPGFPQNGDWAVEFEGLQRLP
jgi:protein-glucosylgalactosylhydroxylysine glucosidase